MIAMHKVAAALLVVFAACEPKRGPEDEANAWRVAVAAAVAHATRGKSVVLEGSTSLGDLRPSASGIVEPFRMKKVGIPKQLVTRFLATNQAPVEVSQAFQRDSRVTVLTSAAIREMFRTSNPGANWETFYQKHEHAAGLFRLSRPAFYRDSALVYVEFSCGDLCGEGHLLLLRKQNDAWAVQTEVMAWIS